VREKRKDSIIDIFYIMDQGLLPFLYYDLVKKSGYANKQILINSAVKLAEEKQACFLPDQNDLEDFALKDPL
jgi:hypothetical protein